MSLESSVNNDNNNMTINNNGEVKDKKLNDDESSKLAKSNLGQSKRLLKKEKLLDNLSKTQIFYNSGFLSTTTNKLSNSVQNLNVTSNFKKRLDNFSSNLKSYLNVNIKEFTKTEKKISYEDALLISKNSLVQSDLSDTFKLLSNTIKTTKKKVFRYFKIIPPRYSISYLVSLKNNLIRDNCYLIYKLQLWCELLRNYNINIIDDIKKDFTFFDYQEVNLYDDFYQCLLETKKVNLKSENVAQQYENIFKSHNMTKEEFKQSNENFKSEYSMVTNCQVMYTLIQEIELLKLYKLSDNSLKPKKIERFKKRTLNLLIKNYQIEKNLITIANEFDISLIKTIKNGFYGINKFKYNNTKRNLNFFLTLFKNLINLSLSTNVEQYEEKWIPINLDPFIGNLQWFNMTFIKGMYEYFEYQTSKDPEISNKYNIIKDYIKKIDNFANSIESYIAFLKFINDNKLDKQLRFLGILYPDVISIYETDINHNFIYGVFSLFKIINCNKEKIINLLYNNETLRYFTGNEIFSIFCKSHYNKDMKLTAPNLRYVIGEDWRKSNPNGFIPINLQELRNKSFDSFLRWDCDILHKGVKRIPEREQIAPVKWLGTFENYDDDQKGNDHVTKLNGIDFKDLDEDKKRLVRRKNNLLKAKPKAIETSYVDFKHNQYKEIQERGKVREKSILISNRENFREDLISSKKFVKTTKDKNLFGNFN